MPERRAFPLDYRALDYAYLERANRTLLELFARHVLTRTHAPRVLDVGAGAGANARALSALAPRAKLVAIEPNARAAELLRAGRAEVHHGSLESWLASAPTAAFDAVLLSDVIEHVEKPVEFLERLRQHPATASALFLVSVPNYAVWYNRVRTLLGRFEYDWSGLYDRTHLRFFTRRSIARLLEHVGLEILEQGSTPSLVQSAAPLLRRGFAKRLEDGEHLTLGDSAAFRAYSRFVEPLETRVCQLWPELLGFQIVTAARGGG